MDTVIEPFIKPEGWSELALYEKIGVYARNLTDKHAKYVDKIRAKDLVNDILGDAIEVAKVVRVLDGWRDLKPEDLNPSHIIKSTHASGWNINITETTAYVDSLFQLRHWNGTFRSPIMEVQYSYIPPRFFIEEKIEDAVTKSKEQCLTYMFRFIHGTRMSIGVGFQGKTNHYDEDWNLILDPELSIDIPKPNRLSDMLKMSHTLAQGFEFVRIDMFYGNNDRIFFSEFTFTPKAGRPIFPLHLEKEYGKLWT